MTRSKKTVAAAALLAGSLVACNDSSPTGPSLTADQQRDLNTLYGVTKAYTDFSRAQAAGYTERLTGCMSDASGGMGYHYGKIAFIDGEDHQLRVLGVHEVLQLLRRDQGLTALEPLVFLPGDGGCGQEDGRRHPRQRAPQSPHHIPLARCSLVPPPVAIQLLGSRRSCHGSGVPAAGPASSAVRGLMFRLTHEIRFAGKPPRRACSRISSSLAARYTQ